MGGETSRAGKKWGGGGREKQRTRGCPAPAYCTKLMSEGKGKYRARGKEGCILRGATAARRSARRRRGAPAPLLSEGNASPPPPAARAAADPGVGAQSLGRPRARGRSEVFVKGDGVHAAALRGVHDPRLLVLAHPLLKEVGLAPGGEGERGRGGERGGRERRIQVSACCRRFPKPQGLLGSPQPVATAPSPHACPAAPSLCCSAPRAGTHCSEISSIQSKGLQTL